MPELWELPQAQSDAELHPEEVQFMSCRIYWDPKPIQSSAHNWSWVHINYDGPPDNRCGAGLSISDCQQQITAMAEELAALSDI